jgi:hypothetical protein
MSFSIELPQTYTFSLCIDREGHTIIDTTVEVPDTREGITRAKRTIQRLMNEYAPISRAPEPVGLNLESQAPAPTDPSPTAETAPTPPPEKKPDGARGLLHLHCKECGRAFTTFLREYQTGMDCKCGHQIDLTVPLATFAYTCPYCEQTRWGKTNREDPDIMVRCKCGGDVNLRWEPKSREYRN